MKILRVLEGNCGDCGKEYRKWLEENLPEDTELHWIENTSGVSGGLFDEDGDDLYNTYWEDFCNSYTEVDIVDHPIFPSVKYFKNKADAEKYAEELKITQPIWADDVVIETTTEWIEEFGDSTKKALIYQHQFGKYVVHNETE